MEPSTGVSDHGKVDDVDSEGRFWDHSPEIDACKVDECYKSDPKQKLLVNVRLMDVQITTLAVLEVEDVETVGKSAVETENVWGHGGY